MASAAPGRPPMAHALSMVFRLTLRAAASFAEPPKRMRRKRIARRTAASSSGVRSRAPRVSFVGWALLLTSRATRIVMLDEQPRTHGGPRKNGRIILGHHHGRRDAVDGAGLCGRGPR